MPDLTSLLAPDSDEEVPDVIDSGSELGSESSDSEDSVEDGVFPGLDSDSEGEIMAELEPKKISGKSFAAMGFSRQILNNIEQKGFNQPTPIQRRAIPVVLEGTDVVGMARTGSGKTAAFVLPMIQRLQTHSAKVGARALILSPSRELAMQTLRVVKDFARKTDLRVVLLIGGDSMEDQFGFMMSNPDIVIATPGRFHHLQVEMRLDLSAMEYVVFDEADRLFEMGFSDQLNEILGSLPERRQTLLFSATLPPTLVEFARAGLKSPQLIRLDADQKISEELEMAFFSVKDTERDAALLYILQDLIKMPAMSQEQKDYLEKRDNYVPGESEVVQRERLGHASRLPTEHSTIVFAPTKHHVEYLSQMLKLNGYAVSSLYGQMDQSARREQLYLFKAGKTSIMVVTDVAARGVDIPMLAYVINYNMVNTARVFVHRVGRTARAGNRGWAYTLVRPKDIPYLADLEVFLGRKITNQGGNYTQKVVLGTLPSSEISFHIEQVTQLLKREYELKMQHDVSVRGEKLYNKTRNPATKEALRRTPEIMEGAWKLPHPLVVHEDDTAKDDLLARLGQRRRRDTVFEFKRSGESSSAQLMARRRAQLAPVQERYQIKHETLKTKTEALKREHEEESGGASHAGRFADKEFFMSHYEPTQSLQDRGYSLHGSAGFNDDARKLGVSLGNEGTDFKPSQVMKWDTKKGKYVNSRGATNMKYIKGENGRKIPASLRSGKFEAWKKQNNHSGRPDDNEASAERGHMHKKIKAPKLPDKKRDDYKKQQDKLEKAMERGIPIKGHGIKSSLRNTAQIHKERKEREKRREFSNNKRASK